jgi:hypothetical protein
VSRGNQFIATSWGWPLEGECRACQHKDRVYSAWMRAFKWRKSLVWRNTQGGLRKLLLRWVSDVEQARADRTWREQPDRPPQPPSGGGTRVRLRAVAA